MWLSLLIITVPWQNHCLSFFDAKIQTAYKDVSVRFFIVKKSITSTTVLLLLQNVKFGSLNLHPSEHIFLFKYNVFYVQINICLPD
jgi:hypothetical protein